MPFAGPARDSAGSERTENSAVHPSLVSMRRCNSTSRQIAGPEALAAAEPRAAASRPSASPARRTLDRKTIAALLIAEWIEITDTRSSFQILIAIHSVGADERRLGVVARMPKYSRSLSYAM